MLNLDFDLNTKQGKIACGASSGPDFIQNYLYQSSQAEIDISVSKFLGIETFANFLRVSVSENLVSEKKVSVLVSENLVS